VVLRGREDVEDAAAHGELPAPLHQVHAVVRGGHQPLGHVRDVGPVAHAQRHGLEVTQSRDNGLEQGTDRKHEHADRARLPRVVAGHGVREAAQHGDPARDGVASGGEPLVRQGLPGGEDRDVVGREEAAERGGEFVGLPAGGGDDGDRATRGRRGDERGAHPRRCGDVERAADGDGVDRLGETGVGEQGREKTGEIHGMASKW